MPVRSMGGAGQAGFSYLIILFAVAIAAAGMGATGMVWHTTVQQQKERELLFIGNQIRNAIAAYRARSPAGTVPYPPSLEDLVKDRRFPVTVRHLRKVWRDPITGSFDWGLIAAPGGGIMGVYSKSEKRPLKRAGFELPDQILEERTIQLGEKMTYREWQFVSVAAQPVASRPVAQPAPAGPSRPVVR